METIEVHCSDGHFMGDKLKILKCTFFLKYQQEDKIIIVEPYKWNTVKEIRTIYNYLFAENKIRILCRDGSFETTKEIMCLTKFPGLVVPASSQENLGLTWVTIDCLDSFQETPYPWHNVKSMKALLGIMLGGNENLTFEILRTFFVRKGLTDVLNHKSRYTVLIEREVIILLNTLYEFIENKQEFDLMTVVYECISDFNKEFKEVLERHIISEELYNIIFFSILRSCSPINRFIHNTTAFFKTEKPYMKEYYRNEIGRGYITTEYFCETEEFVTEILKGITEKQWTDNDIINFVERSYTCHTVWEMYRIPLLGYIMNRETYTDSSGVQHGLFGDILKDNNLDFFDTVPPTEFPEGIFKLTSD